MASELSKRMTEWLLNDKAVKKNLYKKNWISGTSTEVYPITVDEIGIIPRITLQWESHNMGSVRYLMERIFKEFREVTAVDFNRNDGSCPPEVIICYKLKK